MRRVAEIDTRNKKPFNKKKFIFFFIGFLLVFISLVYFINLSDYKVRDIVIKGQVLGSEDELRSLVEDEIAGSYYFIVPKRNMWFYPKSAITKKLREYPQFESVNVSLDNATQNIVVSLEERQPKYLWCRDADCFYMTESGFIFATAPTFEGTPYIIFTGLLEADVIGAVFTDKKSLSEMDQFLTFLDSINEKAKDINFVSKTDVKVETVGGVFFYISLEKPMNDTILSIQTLLDSRDFKAEVSDISTLEYLDVRFGNKAFWKVKSGAGDGTPQDKMEVK